MDENTIINEQIPGKSGENREQVEQKPDVSEYKVGPGRPPLHTRFTSNQQKGEGQNPNTEKHKKTKADKRETREFLKQLTKMKYTFPAASAVRKQLVDAFGQKVLKLTGIELIALQQYQKAILMGDTQAAKFIFENTYGPVKQILEHQGKDGGPIETATTITQVIIENPHADEPNQQQ